MSDDHKALMDGQFTDPLDVIELSRIEREAMRTVIAHIQREQLGTAFQPDPDEAAPQTGHSSRQFSVFLQAIRKVARATVRAPNGSGHPVS
jgi:hypothetical protein